MKLYSAHLKLDAEPVLVREGFSWGACFFGPFWLAMHRAWVAAGLSLAIFILIGTLAAPIPAVTLGTGLAVLLGITGNDLRRLAIEHRGYLLVHVVAARGAEDALLRLLTERPELARRFARDVP